MTVFDLEQVTHLSNHNSSRQGATAGLTKNDLIDLAQSGFNGASTSLAAFTSSVSAFCKRAPDLNDTLRSMIEIKNDQKRQRDVDIQDQTTKRLCLTQQHEIQLKRIELDAKATEGAHERWIKEFDQGMHRPKSVRKEKKVGSSVNDEVDVDQTG